MKIPQNPTVTDYELLLSFFYNKVKMEILFVALVCIFAVVSNTLGTCNLIFFYYNVIILEIFFKYWGDNNSRRKKIILAIC